jgi:hypothetical protein
MHPIIGVNGMHYCTALVSVALFKTPDPVATNEGWLSVFARLYTNKTKTNSVVLSPLANYTD